MSSASDAEDRVNMIPLIDTMFFLILFFMLVTKFTPEEKSIASLLPTGKGPGIGPAVVPPPQVNIAVYPAGLEKGRKAADYERQVDAQLRDGSFNGAVMVRVGGSDPIEVRGRPLSQAGTGSPAMAAEMTALHDYVERELAARDALTTERKDLPAVVISCYSGLDWKFALLAYDAVRAHESRAAGGVQADLLAAREVDFAPPRLRNYTPHELGQELFEIVHLH